MAMGEGCIDGRGAGRAASETGALSAREQIGMHDTAELSMWTQSVMSG